MKETIKILGLLFLVCFTTHIFHNKIRSIPPLGKLLDPFHGYIVSKDYYSPKIKLPNLKKTVEVIWDNNNIPHIFAENDHDLYMTQGYLVAKDRLWQMDFITRLHEGRLSEIIGYDNLVLKNDRFMRKIGIVEGTKASLFSIAYCINKQNTIYEDWKGIEDCPDNYTKIIKEPNIYNMLLSYSQGVNEYIKSLSWDELPIEYKILDYTPDLWTPFRTCVLLKTMSLDLTGRNADVIYEFIKQEYGIENANFLYPEYPYYNDPIIPEEDFKEIILESNQIICSDINQENTNYNFTDIILDLNTMYNPGIGSNNWAVGYEHTKNGHSILANDPHLGLSLPNVWYVVQLSTPNLDIMGATFPGSPGVLSGFNNYIAWGETNGEDDVSDFYKIEIDSQNSNNYIYDGKSIPFDKRDETILIRGNAFQLPRDTTFTVRSTKHGPIIIESEEDNLSQYNRGLTAIYSDVNLAFRWIAHDPTKEIKAFYNLNHATNYEEFLNALIDFECPCQNFVYADISGNIGMYHKGKLPLRCKQHGKGILPGNESQYLWEYENPDNFIPLEHLPLVKNPSRGYVSSANQYPVSENYPYYLPGGYWPAHRASRINYLLENMVNRKDIVIDDMKKIQNDSYNSFADSILTNLLKSIEEKIKDPDHVYIYKALNQWNMNHHSDMFEPIIFEQWYNNINEAVWGDLFINNKRESTFPKHLYPLYDRLAELIIDQKYWDSDWFDDKRTKDIIENFDIIAWNTFTQSIDKLKQNSNDIPLTQWKYSDFKRTDIHHIISSSNFDAFSMLDIITSGSKWSPNAMQEKFGPSWRFIVELKPDSIHGIGIYPGGQSGNPGSEFYDNYIDDWSKGKYFNLNFTYYDNRNNLKGNKIIFSNE